MLWKGIYFYFFFFFHQFVSKSIISVENNNQNQKMTFRIVQIKIHFKNFPTIFKGPIFTEFL
jgi:hypothetical protein